MAPTAAVACVPSGRSTTSANGPCSGSMWMAVTIALDVQIRGSMPGRDTACASRPTSIRGDARERLRKGEPFLRRRALVHVVGIDPGPRLDIILELDLDLHSGLGVPRVVHYVHAEVALELHHLAPSAGDQYAGEVRIWETLLNLPNLFLEVPAMVVGQL